MQNFVCGRPWRRELEAIRPAAPLSNLSSCQASCHGIIVPCIASRGRNQQREKSISLRIRVCVRYFAISRRLATSVILVTESVLHEAPSGVGQLRRCRHLAEKLPQLELPLSSSAQGLLAVSLKLLRYQLIQPRSDYRYRLHTLNAHTLLSIRNHRAGIGGHCPQFVLYPPAKRLNKHHLAVIILRLASQA